MDPINYSFAQDYLRNPASAHTRGNFRGQIYESYVFERLISGETCTVNAEVRYVEKGSYVKSPPEKHENGFNYNKRRQLYYISGGETIAEFDAIGIDSETVWFVEATITENQINIRSLQTEIRRKMKLLEIVIPDRTPKCLLVSVSEKVCTAIRSPPPIVSELVSFPPVDLQEVARRKYPDLVTPINLLIPLSELNRLSLAFDYFDVVREYSNRAYANNDIKLIADDINRSHQGLIERFYWGRLKFEEVYHEILAPESLPGTPDSDCVVYFEVSADGQPVVRFAVRVRETGKKRSWYGMGSRLSGKSPTRIKGIKRKAKELRDLYDEIPRRSLTDMRSVSRIDK